MPELAEAAYFARQWPCVPEDLVVRVQCNGGSRVFREISRPLQGVGAIRGAGLEERRTHGKRMFFRFGDRTWLELHLGMTGSLSCQRRGYRRVLHDELVIQTERSSLVFRDPRKFGAIRLHPVEGFANWWAKLPPEILSRRFTRSYFESQMRARAGAQLKPLLLEQSLFPGVGNWMADEVLWRAGHHPACRAGSLEPEETARLWRVVRRVCSQALRVIGETWDEPPRSWLFQHRWKDGGRCPRRGCGAELQREKLGGRTACWCPHCQRLPTMIYPHLMKRPGAPRPLD